jgi:transposase InsO family protein
LIQLAITLRREVPNRSVKTIIEILVLEGRVHEGVIKESTLQDKLMERGYSSRQMRLYQENGIAARRFQRLNRNDLWQADIKFGPKITVKGESKQIYLAAFIDDATRLIVHAEFYDNLEQKIIEDCLKKAIIKEGTPLRLYFDNGGQFRNKWMGRVCAKLGITLLFTKPYSPESKGKIERFNRTVGAFMDEAKLQNLQTLDAYNHYLNVWITECYHNKTHAGLKDTPQNTYGQSKTPLRFVDHNLLREAFLHSETRKVDKAGCISLNRQLYEVSLTLIGQQVEILYDPMDKSEITVKHKPTSFEKRAYKLKIGTKAATRPKLPDFMLPAPASSSRLLDAKESKFTSRVKEKSYAISYAAFDDDNDFPACHLSGGEDSV